jgi:arylsulfatase A-like enzyme
MIKASTILATQLLTLTGYSLLSIPEPFISISNDQLEVNWIGKADLYESGDLEQWNLVGESVVSPHTTSVSNASFFRVDHKVLEYTVVDTSQAASYDENGNIITPVPGDPYHGQDAVYSGTQPSYTDNQNGTVTDNSTGLMWQQVPPEAFYTWEEAQAYAENLVLGGHDDWRLPTMKESISLADFRGSSRPQIDRPYIDDTVFTIHDPLVVTTYIPSSAENPNRPKRNIDGQYWSSNAYIGRTMNNNTSTFGFNFLDGRIKSYPNGLSGRAGTCFVRCVRGPADYGENNYIDNEDGTITDLATGLMWLKEDSGATVGTLDWIEALAWSEELEYAGYDDWRLPDAKELHTLVDYSRAPDAEDESRRSAAIDPIFELTEMESWFWSSSSLGDDLFAWAVYVCFGQASAVDTNTGLPTINAHGAGAMRSDPKTGDPQDFVGEDGGHGPQNDQVRIQNYVRPVRTAFERQDIEPEVEQPNILLLIVDDWGIDSSPLYNSNPSASLPPMPTFDTLAGNGLLFRNAYAQPTCSPTRTNILTGRYSFRHGVGAPVKAAAQLTEEEITIPEVFAAAGSPYALASFGKYHLNSGQVNSIADTPNTIAGWPHFSGGMGGGVGDYYNWTKVTNGTVEQNISEYTTSVTVDDASQWIINQGDNPWFCWIGFNAAHTPFHKPPEELHSYTGLPDTPMGPNRRPAYEAALEALDTEISRLLESVDLSKTMIVVMGDNGSPSGVAQPPFDNSHAKGSLYEGGTHVPFFITGPTVQVSGETSALVHCVDLFDTILEWAGIDYENHVPLSVEIDSVSLSPVLSGGTNSREFALCESFGSDNDEEGLAVTDGRYKLVRISGLAEEFYDLSVDENEQDNLLQGTLNPEQQIVYESMDTFLAELD